VAVRAARRSPFFGQHINTTSAVAACVFLGIICLILVIRQAFNTLNKAIAAP
jgi:hypothetical protein